jgi:hypothetical protein
MLNQLTFDPNTGASTSISADGPVLLAFARGDVVSARLQGTPAVSTGDVLYFVPLPIAIRGQVTFSGDLMQGTAVSSDGQMAGMGGKGGGGPGMIFMSGGTATQAYRPPIFDGTLSTTKLTLAVNQASLGGAVAEVRPTGSGDLPLSAAEQAQIVNDGTPFVELFDRTAAAWVRLARIGNSAAVTVADPSRYVDPSSGTVLVRFRSTDQNGGFGFAFQVQLEGKVQ